MRIIVPLTLILKKIGGTDINKNIYQDKEQSKYNMENQHKVNNI